MKTLPVLAAALFYLATNCPEEAEARQPPNRGFRDDPIMGVDADCSTCPNLDTCTGLFDEMRENCVYHCQECQTNCRKCNCRFRSCRETCGRPWCKDPLPTVEADCATCSCDEGNCAHDCFEENDCLLPALTVPEVEAVKDVLRPVLVGRLAGHTVRAVFQDSVGGMDGCINRNIGFNTGFAGPGDFANIIGVLDNLYAFYGFGRGLISAADFYVLAGEVAVENAFGAAQKAAGACSDASTCIDLFRQKTDLNFKYGREDCPTSPVTDEVDPFPSGHLDSAGVFAFFASQYGMDVEESVAIMGAHTLGRATGASGWCGLWSGDDEVQEFRFNNLYYDNMINDTIDFVQIRKPDFVTGTGAVIPRFQWNGTQLSNEGEPVMYMMLNADMALLKDIRLDTGTAGESSCTFDDCADSDGADYVHKFAADQDAWYAAFSRAWQKMVTAKVEGTLRSPKPA